MSGREGGLHTRFALNKGDWIAMTCNVPAEDAEGREGMREWGEDDSVWVANEDAARAPALVEEVKELRKELADLTKAATEVAARSNVSVDVGSGRRNLHTVEDRWMEALESAIYSARALLPEPPEAPDER